MKSWPLNTKVPEDPVLKKADMVKTALKKVPQKGEAGSFWEDGVTDITVGLTCMLLKTRRLFRLKEESSLRPG